MVYEYVCMHMQFTAEFNRLQPGAEDFFTKWSVIAPHVVAYSMLKKDNLEVLKLLSELNGDDGQPFDDVEPCSG